MDVILYMNHDSLADTKCVQQFFFKSSKMGFAHILDRIMFMYELIWHGNKKGLQNCVAVAYGNKSNIF